MPIAGDLSAATGRTIVRLVDGTLAQKKGRHAAALWLGEIPAALAAQAVAAFVEPLEGIVGDATPDRRDASAVCWEQFNVTSLAALVGLGNFISALIMCAIAGTVPVAIALLRVSDHRLIAMSGAPFGHMTCRMRSGLTNRWPRRCPEHARRHRGGTLPHVMPRRDAGRCGMITVWTVSSVGYFMRV